MKKPLLKTAKALFRPVQVNYKKFVQEDCLNFSSNLPEIAGEECRNVNAREQFSQMYPSF